MSKHTCHAVHCRTEVPPRKLMCPKHWRLVPDELKGKVYQSYVLGQCESKRPSKLYLEYARQAISAVYEVETPTPTPQAEEAE